jgi:Putative MetA-pathway of phenol degradation
VSHHTAIFRWAFFGQILPIFSGLCFLLNSGRADAQQHSHGPSTVSTSSMQAPPLDLNPIEMESQPILLSPPDGSQSNNLVNTKTAAINPTEPPALMTSRPSFTDAVVTVPQGSLQSENGASFIDNQRGTYSWTTPETLLRLGLFNNTELRMTVPNYTYIGNRKPGNLANHFGDISVGLSQHIRVPGKVDLAVIPILNIPSGANPLSSHALAPQLRLVWGKYVTDKLLLSGMMDTRWNTGSKATSRVLMTPTLIGYYSFTKKWTGFFEYAGVIPSHGKSAQYLQGGILYLPSPRQQLDARLTVGLNKTSPNIVVGFGYSFRVDGLFGNSRDFSSFRCPQKKSTASTK